MNLEIQVHQAVAQGNVARVRELAALGADVNWQGPGGGPMHMAAMLGKVEVIRALVEVGADKETRDANGARPLHIATINCQEEVVKLLIQLGVDKHAQTADGATAHALSLEFRLPEMARVLEAAGAESTAATAGACAACGSSSSSPDAAFKKCSRCKAVRYCSVLCQRMHWPVHKASCSEGGGGL